MEFQCFCITTNYLHRSSICSISTFRDCACFGNFRVHTKLRPISLFSDLQNCSVWNMHEVICDWQYGGESWYNCSIHVEDVIFLVRRNRDKARWYNVYERVGVWLAPRHTRQKSENSGKGQVGYITSVFGYRQKKYVHFSCEAVIFVFLGFSIFSKDHKWDIGFTTITVTTCFMVRFLGLEDFY